MGGGEARNDAQGTGDCRWVRAESVRGRGVLGWRKISALAACLASLAPAGPCMQEELTGGGETGSASEEAVARPGETEQSWSEEGGCSCARVVGGCAWAWEWGTA